MSDRFGAWWNCKFPSGFHDWARGVALDAWLVAEQGQKQEIEGLREENDRLTEHLKQFTTTKSYYISGEEVERYCALPLTERLKDRGGLMKCVPGGVVDTIIEATDEIERLLESRVAHEAASTQDRKGDFDE